MAVLAEAQQPPAIVERSDRFDSAPVMDPSFTVRNAFIADQITAEFENQTQQALDAQPRQELPPALQQMLEQRKAELNRPEAGTTRERKFVIVPGVDRYRDVGYNTHAMLPDGGDVNYIALGDTEINAQKALIDARLAANFSKEDVSKLETMANSAKLLTGIYAYSRAAEYRLEQKNFANPLDVPSLGGVKIATDALAERIDSGPLKEALQSVGRKFDAVCDRGMLLHRQGKALDDEFAAQYAAALEDLRLLGKKAQAELLGSVDEVKQISATSASRAEPADPAASAKAAEHLRVLAEYIAIDGGLSQLSGEKIHNYIAENNRRSRPEA